MAKLKKKNKSGKEIHPEFRARLRKYSELLSLIERDYSDKRLLPEHRNLEDIQEKQIDLFAWARDVEVSTYLRAMKKRLARVRELRKEIHHILRESLDRNNLKDVDDETWTES